MLTKNGHQQGGTDLQIRLRSTLAPMPPWRFEVAARLASGEPRSPARPPFPANNGGPKQQKRKVQTNPNQQRDAVGWAAAAKASNRFYALSQ